MSHGMPWQAKGQSLALNCHCPAEPAQTGESFDPKRQNQLGIFV
jgi:hypothetical protein